MVVRWVGFGFCNAGFKVEVSDRLGFVGVNTGYERLINQHNRVGQISSAREIITILLACICRVRINNCDRFCVHIGIFTSHSTAQAAVCRLIALSIPQSVLHFAFKC